MGYRKTAKKIVEQGDCNGIDCSGCPLSNRYNPNWAEYNCDRYPHNGGSGKDEDYIHNRVCYAKQYLKEHPKKGKEVIKETSVDHSIGTIWECTTPNGEWKAGDRAKLIGFTETGLGVFEGKIGAYGLDTGFVVQVKDESNPTESGVFRQGNYYIDKEGSTIVLCTSAGTNYHFYGVKVNGSTKGTFSTTWTKEAFVPVDVSIVVIEV